MAASLGGGGGGALGAAAKAVAQTAGTPNPYGLNFSGLDFSGVPSASALAALGQRQGTGTLPNSAQQLAWGDPSAYQYVPGRVPGMEFSRGGIAYDANGQPQGTSVYATLTAPQPTTGSSAPGGPSLSDVLTALIGPSPTMADYYSPSTYQSALASIAQGNKSAQGQISGAYDAASKNLSGLDATLNQGATTNAQQFNAQQQQAKATFDQYAQQAQQLGGQGGQLGARMNALGATFAAQQASQQNLNSEIGSVGQFNAAQDQAGLGASKQAALNALASSVNAADNRISTTSISDQSRAQAAYAKALQAYQSKANSLTSQAYSGLQAEGGFGGKDWADAQLGNWSRAAVAGDQNAFALTEAASRLIAPTVAGGKPPSYLQALHNLQDPRNVAALGGANSIMYGILFNWLQNRYGYSRDTLGGNPTQSDYANYLAQRYLPAAS